MQNKSKLIFLSLLIIISFNACFVTPLVDSFKGMGVTKSDREELINKTIKHFYANLRTNNYVHITQFLAKERKDALLRELRMRRKVEKLVDGKIDVIEFNEDSHQAEVEVLVKYYEAPFFVLNERIEKQIWKFVGSQSGWRLFQRSVLSNTITNDVTSTY